MLAVKSSDYDGEEYDARMEMPGWDRVGFDDSRWAKAQVLDSPGGRLESRMYEPMRIPEPTGSNPRCLKPSNETNPIIDLHHPAACAAGFAANYRLIAPMLCRRPVNSYVFRDASNRGPFLGTYFYVPADGTFEQFGTGRISPAEDTPAGGRPKEPLVTRCLT